MKYLILASGGDAPAINNYLKFLIEKLDKNDLYYSEYGLQGVSKNTFKKIDKQVFKFLYDMPSSYIKCGRFIPFKNDLKQRENIIKNVSNFDYLILLGGNGSQKAAKIFHENKIKTIFVPLTIDNDVDNTDVSLGFFTSLRETIKNINNISYTMDAHGYVGLVEIMGRKCSDLTKEALILSKANLAVYKENISSPIEFAQKVKNKYKNLGTCTCLVMEKMKYSINDYAKEIEKMGLKARITSLGHTQRGGIASFVDIKIASIFADLTIKSIKQNQSGFISIKNFTSKFNKY